jgi:predicted acylesterase/phospholipase RssA
MVTKAITLGGGGPAAGLHIGVLEALLAGENITFDVWALSCIGAWVGIVYNQFDDENVANKVEKTYEFFRDGVFRDDEGYKRFPINTVFGPDWRNNIDALNKFVTNPDNYKDLWNPYKTLVPFQDSLSMLYGHLADRSNTTDGVFRDDESDRRFPINTVFDLWNPYKMLDLFQDSLSMLYDSLPYCGKFKRLDDGDLNRWILNQVMAPNPFVRYLASVMYLSSVNGLSKINYPKSDFMKGIEFNNLYKNEKPFIFHNAWNLDEQKLAQFCNLKKEDPSYNGAVYEGSIDASTLCACSALPFVEETVEIDKVTYCEGALVDTVNFKTLHEQHSDLDEIWVSRIVDSSQIRKPKNLHDGLANLCQLFAATVGEDDVSLFKYHIKYDDPWPVTVVEIRVPGHINFKWNHSNLENARELGRAAAEQAIGAYKKYMGELKKNALAHGPKPHFVNENPERDDADGWKKLLDKYEKLKKRAVEL